MADLLIELREALVDRHGAIVNGDDLNVGTWTQSKAAMCDDLIARCDAATDLDEARLSGA